MTRTRKISAKHTITCIVITTAAVLCMICWKADAENAKNEKTAPATVNTAIQKAFPEAQITNVETEIQEITIYEVDLLVNGQKRTLEVSSDGQILSVEKIINSQDMPPVVAKAIAQKVENGEIMKFEHREVRAVFVVKHLVKPENVYEAEYKKDGKSMESVFNSDGKQIED